MDHVVDAANEQIPTAREARRPRAGDIATGRLADRLVERRPEIDAAAERRCDVSGVFGKLRHGCGVSPAGWAATSAGSSSHCGSVKWCSVTTVPYRGCGCDRSPRVVGNRRVIECVALRLDPAPFDRQAVGVDAQLPRAVEVGVERHRIVMAHASPTAGIPGRDSNSVQSFWVSPSTWCDEVETPSRNPGGEAPGSGEVCGRAGRLTFCTVRRWSGRSAEQHTQG